MGALGERQVALPTSLSASGPRNGQVLSERHNLSPSELIAPRRLIQVSCDAYKNEESTGVALTWCLGGTVRSRLRGGLEGLRFAAALTEGIPP